MLPCLLAALLIAQEPADDRPAPVAVILEVAGRPTRTAGEQTRPARRIDLLRPGDRLAAGPGGSVTVLFAADGHVETLHEATSIVVGEAGGGDPVGRVERRPSRLSPPNLEALRDRIRGGAIGGGVPRAGDAWPAVAPVDGAVVATSTPTFRWPAVAGAEGYRVELLSGAAVAAEMIVWSREARATELPYPGDMPELGRLRVYRWRVAASMPDGTESTALKQGRFLVGPPELAAQADDLATLAREGGPTEKLLAAIALESLGLLDELYPLYAGLAEQAKTDPNLWRKAAEHADRAGRSEEAAAFQKKAEELGGTPDRP